MKDFPQLPLWHHLPEIREAFSRKNCAVIEAEPGAGKTMLVPVLAKEFTSNSPGLTILTAPRRIAVRAAASGIAAMHEWQLGKETGFTVRGENCRCQSDGILAVTPGVLLQMLQHDPALEGVSALIFDEFHERTLEMDLALALTLDMRSSLREDLLLAVMSATMESEKLGKFLDAPVIKVPGRGFPVEIIYRESSADLRDIPRETARAVMENAFADDGHILAFLPGENEIRQCQEMLKNFAAEKFALRRLCGSLPLDEQRAAISPEADNRRKIILSTNVAESSLTIDGVTTVIDSGWEKRAVWSPGAQMNFLELRRITRDSAVQRAGRAGRTAPGRAVRCYNSFTFENLIPHAEAELLSADLTGVVLSAGCWGTEAENLRLPDPPPAANLDAARAVLRRLRLISAENRPTAEGKRAAMLPISPRIAAMMLQAPAAMRRTAANLAGILEEKDDFRRFDSVNLLDRLAVMDSGSGNCHLQRSIARKLLKEFPPAEGKGGDPGVLIAAAFPEWIGRRRDKNSAIYQLAGGGAAVLAESDPLRQEEFLAIARLDGNGSGNSVIRLALPIGEAALKEKFADLIQEQCVTVFSAEQGKLSASVNRMLGELVLSRRSCAVPPGTAIPALIREAYRRQITLPPPEDKRSAALTARIGFARKNGMMEVPEINEEFLLAAASSLPDELTTLNELKKIDWYTVLRSMFDYQTLGELDRLCPEFFTAPTGMKFPIDYSGEQPSLSIQIQQLYGVTVHPAVGKNRMPLRIELLSPARRPVQITCDLPGFWQGTWKLVRSEMRSRYPKHEWPEDPANAAPMRRSIKKQ